MTTSVLQLTGNETELPSVLRLDGCGEASVVRLGEGKDERAGVDILLYTGQPVDRWGTKMVFSLRGMDVPNGQMPILFAHRSETPIGFNTEKPTRTGGLRVRGELFDASRFSEGSDIRQAIEKIRETSAQGLKWQASMGIRLSEVKWLSEGESMQVNGAKFEGPGYCVTRSKLLEASVLTLGADGGTQSQLLQLSSAEAGTVPVNRSEPMADTKKTDAEALAAQAAADAEKKTREGLTAFLAAFPPERQGWAAQKFAAGLSVVEAKAELADELTEKLASERAERAELEQKLAAVATEGHQEQLDFAGREELDGSGQKMDLSALPKAVLREMSLGDLAEQLAPEFARLSAHERFAFGSAKDYAAFRRAEAQGQVRIHKSAIDPTAGLVK